MTYQRGEKVGQKGISLTCQLALDILGANMNIVPEKEM